MRYLPLTPDDRTAMLAAIGAKSIDDLFVDVPKAAHRDGFVDLPRVAGEMEVERALGAMAAKNASAGSVPFFCGAGAYKHHVPATVDHVIQRSEFLMQKGGVDMIIDRRELRLVIARSLAMLLRQPVDALVV